MTQHLSSPTATLFRLLRQDQDGRWWAVYGDGCSAQPFALTFAPQHRAEMLWSATGILEGAMLRHWQAVRSDARSLLFPIHYPPESVATLRRQKRQPTPTDFPAPWRADPDAPPGAFTTSYQEALSRGQDRAWRGGRVWASWLERAYQDAASPKGAWGLGGLDYYTQEATTAHGKVAIKAIIRNLRPLGKDTCRVRLWRPFHHEFYPPLMSAAPL